MFPQRISFQPSVGRSIPFDLLRAMPGHWQLRELAGAYVNGNGRYLNVSSEPARCKATAEATRWSRPRSRSRRLGDLIGPHFARGLVAPGQAAEDVRFACGQGSEGK